MRTPPIVLLATAAALLITACGSTPAARPGEDQKTADQIFADAFSAFSTVPAVRETLSETVSSGSATIVVDETQDQAHFTITAGGTTFAGIMTGGRAYLGIGGAFQEQSGAAATHLLAILPAQQASCNTKQHGHLTKGATSTINGKRVIEIKNDGQAPGGQAGSLFVALDGPPLPIRAIQTGAVAAGGDPACGVSSSTTRSGQFDFDYAQPPVTVTAPAVVITPTP